jgi:hypothetical protein
MARSMFRAASALALATAAAGATAALAAPPPGHGHGHGALKATLVHTTTWSPAQCAAAAAGAAQGFAVLNAPGRPGGAPHRIVGTVSLKSAPEHNAAFEVDLAVGNTCQPTGTTLSTNSVGNGTAHFDVTLPADNTATSYYVVLKAPTTFSLPVPLPPQLPNSFPVNAEAYASQPVALS